MYRSANPLHSGHPPRAPQPGGNSPPPGQPHGPERTISTRIQQPPQKESALLSHTLGAREERTGNPSGTVGLPRQVLPPMGRGFGKAHSFGRLESGWMVEKRQGHSPAPLRYQVYQPMEEVQRRILYLEDSEEWLAEQGEWSLPEVVFPRVSGIEFLQVFGDGFPYPRLFGPEMAVPKPISGSLKIKSSKKMFSSVDIILQFSLHLGTESFIEKKGSCGRENGCTDWGKRYRT